MTSLPVHNPKISDNLIRLAIETYIDEQGVSDEDACRLSLESEQAYELINEVLHTTFDLSINILSINNAIKAKDNPKPITGKNQKKPAGYWDYFMRPNNP